MRHALVCLVLVGCSGTSNAGVLFNAAAESRDAAPDAAGERDRDDGGVASQPAGPTGPVTAPDAGCGAPAVWYRDADGDGFGAKGTAPVALCGSSDGYVKNALDCGDEDARANPKQEYAQATPIVGKHTGGAFDFNCDGTEYPVFEGAYACVTDTWCTRARMPVTAPACGQGVPSVTQCSGTAGTCTATPGTSVTSCL